MCAIIRKPTVSSPSLRERPMCCPETSASVQWVATRIVFTPQSTAIRRCSTVPMPGQQQRRDARALHARDDGAQVLLVGVQREAVVDRRAAEAVAVGHLDERHARRRRARVATATICSSVMRWRFGCIPSRRRHVVERDAACLARSIRAHDRAILSAKSSAVRTRRGGHDVEVAGVLRQVVAEPLHLHEGADAPPVEDGAVLQRVAGHVALHLARPSRGPSA